MGRARSVVTPVPFGQHADKAVLFEPCFFFRHKAPLQPSKSNQKPSDSCRRVDIQAGPGAGTQEAGKKGFSWFIRSECLSKTHAAH